MLFFLGWGTITSLLGQRSREIIAVWDYARGVEGVKEALTALARRLIDRLGHHSDVYRPQGLINQGVRCATRGPALAQLTASRS